MSCVIQKCSPKPYSTCACVCVCVIIWGPIVHRPMSYRVGWFRLISPCTQEAIPPAQLGLSGRNSAKILERLRRRSERFSWNSPREYGWEPERPYNPKHLKPPDCFQNCRSLSTAGGAASFFRSVSGEGLSELVMDSESQKKTPKEIQHKDFFLPPSPLFKMFCVLFFPHFKEKNSPNTKNFRG